MKLPTLFSALALLGASTTVSLAAETPEAVAHTYIRAMADQRLNVVADQMHGGALERFKEIIVSVGDAIAAAPAERRPSPKMISALFGEAGPGAMKELPAREVFVRFMSNLTTFVPQIREMHAGSEYQVIGHVDEGGNVTHVVFRATLKRGETELTKMDVISLKREGESWRVLLTDDLESLVSAFGKRLAAPAPPAPAAAPAPVATPVPKPR